MALVTLDIYTRESEREEPAGQRSLKGHCNIKKTNRIKKGTHLVNGLNVNGEKRGAIAACIIPEGKHQLHP